MSSSVVTNTHTALTPATFTPQELELVKEARTKIDINDVMTIISIDEHATKELSVFNNKILSAVKSTDIPDLSGLIAIVRGGVVSLDPNVLTQKPSFLTKIFGSAKDGLEKYKEKSKDISEKFDDVVKHINKNVIQAKSDYDSIAELFQINRELFIKYNILLAAAKEEKEYQEKEILPQYIERAESGDTADKIALNEYQSSLRALDKKIYTLVQRRLGVIHSTQAIQNMRDNIIATILNSTELLVSGIEEWKRDVAQGIIAFRTNTQATDIKNINDIRNQIKKKSADLLYDTSIKVTTLAENGAIDVETIRYVNDKLIKTMQDNKKIIDDSSVKRRESLLEFEKIEKDFFKALEEN